MTQAHASLVDAVRGISSSGSVARNLAENLESKALVHKLFGLRCSKGVTQTELAKRLECSQSRISKIENGEDDDIRLGDLRVYLTALGAELNITVFAKKPTAVEKIKHHVFAVKKSLDDLAALANGDQSLAKSIGGFFGECFFNMVRVLQHSSSKLPVSPESGAPFFDVTVEMLDEDDDCAEVAHAIEHDCATTS